MQPRRLLPALLVLCVLAVAATALVVVRRADEDGPPREVGRTALGEWDAARAQAWAAGDLTALGDLYVDGSSAGRRDVALLQLYVDRELRVEGMQTQVLAFEEVSSAPDRVEVQVTDRVVGAVAVAGGGEGRRRIRLPTAHPAPRRIVLVRREGRWVVESVRAWPAPQAVAAARTSRTS